MDELVELRERLKKAEAHSETLEKALREIAADVHQCNDGIPECCATIAAAALKEKP
jgi:septal ring factor EnvC (AmiA/AmiB activator)